MSMPCILCENEASNVDDYCHNCGEYPVCQNCLINEWCPACNKLFVNNSQIQRQLIIIKEMILLFKEIKPELQNRISALQGTYPTPEAVTKIIHNKKLVGKIDTFIEKRNYHAE